MGSKYIYAIAPADSPYHFTNDGIAGIPVNTIEENGLVAVVSSYEGKKIRPERRNLAAHQKTLKDIMQSTTPLPMSFGVVADDEDSVRSLLREHNTDLKSGLERVAAKVEMGLKVRWDADNIFEYFVDMHPPLRALRDMVFAGDREVSQGDKLELGRLFEQFLAEDRERFTLQVEKLLQDCCHEIRRGKLKGENDVMNLACLIDKGAEEAFEKSVFKAAEEFDNNYIFDFNGPWAPYNFVDVRFEM